MSDVKNFVSVTDRSTKAIVTATTGLGKVIAELQALGNSSETLATEIQFRQGELNTINAEYDQKVAEAASDMRIRVLNNEDKVLEGLLKARGLTTISPADLNTLQYDLQSARNDNETAINEAVSQAQRESSRETQARLAQQDSTHKVAIAELTANSNAKTDRIEMLTEQLEAARADLKAERETRLAIAQAESGRQGVVVNAGK